MSLAVLVSCLSVYLSIYPLKQQFTRQQLVSICKTRPKMTMKHRKPSSEFSCNKEGSHGSCNVLLTTDLYIFISIYLSVSPSLYQLLSVGITWQEANWGYFRNPTRRLFTAPCEDSVGFPPAVPGPEPIFKGEPSYPYSQ